MDKLKQWVILSLAASLVIVAGGWFLAVGPKRSEAADLRAQAADQVSANSAAETQLQVLRAKAKDLPKEQAKLAAVAAKIPADPALPSLVRALLEAAEASGVELVSVAPGTPELLVAAAPAAVEPPAEGQTVGEPAPAPAPDPAADAAGAAGQLAKIAVAISVVGDYFEVQQFMAALETLPRALRVDNLSVVPGVSPTSKDEVDVEDGRSLTSEISGLVFMAANRPPASAASVPADAVPADPAVDTAAAPTSTD